VLRPLLISLALLGIACDTLPPPHETDGLSAADAQPDPMIPSFVHADAEDSAVRVTWGVPSGASIAGARVSWAMGNDSLPWPGDLVVVVVDATDTRIEVPVNDMTVFATVALIDGKGVEHPESDVVWATPTRKIGSLIPIPAGSFTMGWDGGLEGNDESPAHSPWLSDYAIDRYPATVQQYEACVAEDACPEPTIWGGWIADVGWVEDLRVDAGDHPAVGLTHEAAEALCAYRSLRLPTEAEWEKAARGTEDLHAFPWGGMAPSCALASYTDDAGEACEEGTREVGSRPDARGPMGLHDTAGGAWEWVADWYEADAYAAHAPTDPTGPASGEAHVLRSGAWNASPEALYLTARRPGFPPSHLLHPAPSNYSARGVRCARSLP
jgi:formylglycine-generating enzyme required for sulfatase activity